ncbi:hypothetical protein [Halorhodospira neutriphila]|uniref:Type II secretion system protein GspC N-terminal domain-containing protein n=1 Tax=Halorhodospira neutriphila TaxID=168379 RepID=A0ABS1E607_9GAMM|nr:hypothetical protein [Halorhodospira neutriphila]MBK1725816.1 hypothetical protein [Halorhodospira neutriphila]
MNSYFIFLILPVLALAGWWGGNALGGEPGGSASVAAVEALEMPEGLEQIRERRRRESPPIDMTAFQPAVSEAALAAASGGGSGDGGGDPQAKAAEAAPEPPRAQEQLDLVGVMIHDDRRVAHIGGEVVQIGDAVLGYRVQRIEMDRVVVSGPRGWEEVRFAADL